MIGILADKALAELGVNDLPWQTPPILVQADAGIRATADPLRQGFAWLAFWEHELLIDFMAKKIQFKTGGTWSKPLDLDDNIEHLARHVAYARAWHKALVSQQKKIRKQKTTRSKGARNENDR